MKWRAFILLLIAVVATATYFYFFRRQPAKPAGELPPLLALTPRQTTWVIYVDLDVWRLSPLMDHLTDVLPSTEADLEYQQFIAATGFDYSRDLDHLLVALLPLSEPLPGRRLAFQGVAFADGRFDRKRIADYTLRHGRRETHGEVEIFVARASTASTRSNLRGLAVLSLPSDGRVILAEAPSGFPHLLDRARNVVLAATKSPEMTTASPIAERAQRIAGAPLFIVGRADSLPPLGQELSRSLPLAEQIQSILSNVQWLSLAARPEQDQVRVSLQGECESVWKAGQLALLLDALRLFGRGALQNPKLRLQIPPEQLMLLEKVVETANISREKNVVEMRLQIPAALFLPPSVHETSREADEAISEGKKVTVKS